MSVSDDEDVLAILYLINMNNNNGRGKRRYWVHPYWRENVKERGAFNVFKELNMSERFQSFYRMRKETFNLLLYKIEPVIFKQDTNFRTSVSPEERLLITLRYFATQASFKALSFYFLRGHTTIRRIVVDTAVAIWEVLQPEYMPTPTKECWLKTADRYWELWNLPNCVGSIDGKHIRIKAPPKSGSAFYNYKQYFSIVLLAVADADGMFLSINVGEYGRNSDGRVLKESSFGKALFTDQLQLPDPTPLPGDDEDLVVPFYFAADEAFPLNNHIMKPYPRRQLTNPKRIYNYRISRGRRSVECAFGMLTSKFRLMETPICCDVNKIDRIIKAVCVLHNYIRIHDGVFSKPTVQISVKNTTEESPSNLGQGNRQRPTNTALDLRNRLCNFFLHPNGELPYQDKYCV